MNSKERISRILRRQPTDRMGLYEHFWADTQRAWTSEGHIDPGESMARHFGFDLDEAFCFEMTADLDFKRKIVDETDDTITFLDGNGAVLREHKHHDSTPEHVSFTVIESEPWEELIKPKLVANRRRIDFELYRKVRDECRADDRFFLWSGLNVFECMSRLSGHENLLAGMVLEPEWVSDMAMTYAKLIVELQEMLFEEEGLPDGIWYYEDMGYKGSPFMSPQMYRELLKPAHTYMFNAAKAHGLPIIMHSCGFVEPLLPHVIEAGIDCLEAMEVKAGMDLVKLQQAYGDRISLMGGLDVRALCSNDRAAIDQELLKLSAVKPGHNYVIHTDHSVPKTVEYDMYRYFIERSLELGTYE